MHNIVNFERVKLSCKQCSLSELCLPRGMDSDDLERFEHLVGQKTPLPKGASLYHSGDELSCLYAVRSGSLKSVVITEDGEEQIVGFHLPGELVGFDGVDDSHSCSVISLERTSVCELPMPKLQSLASELPTLNSAVFGLMSREISQDQSMLLLLAKRTAESRLASFIMSLSKRLNKRGFSDTELVLPMSRHDIANYLGLAAETISRLIARFQEEQILEVNRRHITILDKQRLYERVSGCVNQRVAQVD